MLTERRPMTKPALGSSESIVEVTLRGVLLALVISTIMTAANAYLGLYAGMTVSTSIPAAIISMGYSPYWSVDIDGQGVESQSDRGLISVPVGAGEHEMVISYATPIVHHLAQIVSILAWGVTVVWLGVQVVRRNGRNRMAEPPGE